MLSVIFVAASLITSALGQGIGTETAEQAPPITYSTCTTSGGCATHDASIVLDGNYRWIHTANLTSCNPAGFNRTICPDATTCAENCLIEGVDLAGYQTTYGITTDGDALNLVFGSGGSRVYLLDPSGNYTNFKVLNQEFTFDIDISNVPCGYNAALYFSEMEVDGGLSSLNKAGAKYGTGYCDSQCPKGDFFDGIVGLLPPLMVASVNFDGSLGACCNEMDLWEANSVATQLTPHPCEIPSEITCSGSQCTSVCDPSGCDFNPFRMGNPSFYGPGLTIDTNKPFTVVTQFVTNDGTDTGTLSEIRRIYVQNGVVIQNAAVNIPGLPAVNSLSQAFCTDKINTLSDAASFNTFGGLAQMGASLARGAVLVISLWDSLGSGMFWLDGLEGSNPSSPGALRGNCTTANSISDPSTSVTFSNIKVGDLNSTFAGLVPPPISSSSSSGPTSTSSAPPAPTQTHWGQCGGMFYSGPIVCASPFTCQESNPYYSQCL
ncbi:cellulase [Mycena metata]|uniref:Glucanase n=1 Tax=Mycena metata TaxID=1033252 RepID=A0AAD7I8L5_9AGAR|nr:cellulase [Mycena metata]